jgi:beta-lactamase superfamily II metal-dependent hydrolase
MRHFARCLGLLIGVVAAAMPAYAGPLLLDMLDIGQGDALLLRAGGKTVLVDAGDRSSDTEDQLRALGVTQLDLVVATHAHADHIGRMDKILSEFEVSLYLDSGLAHTTQTYNNTMTTLAAQGIPYQPAREGMTIGMGDEVLITVLHPSSAAMSGTRSDLNSNSVVLLVEHHEVSMLLTGDAEEPTEYRLLRQGVGDIDILKVAHHGSNHSSSRSFLAATQPELALISCGSDNRYGHPGSETVERLVNAGASIYRTDKSGHLRVISNGTRYEVFEGSLAELGVDWPVDEMTAEGVFEEPIVASTSSTSGSVVGEVPSGLQANAAPVLTPRQERRRRRQERKEARMEERRRYLESRN